MLICMKKINFISHFIFKVLQRKRKIVILGNLGTPGYTHLKWWYQFEETFNVFLQTKKTTSFFLFSLRYFKDIANLLFWVLWVSLVTHIKNTITLLKTFVLICRQNNHFNPMFFMEILQSYANFLFGMLWACLDAHCQNGNINF